MTIRNIFIPIMLLGAVFMLFSCNDDDQESFEMTRLFRPVNSQPLMTMGNVIIINIGDLKDAVNYTFEISRDTFQNIDYTFETDTNIVHVDTNVLGGEELLWNTLYQVRATAHAEDPQFDSKPSDLGSVRTQRFPSILNVPSVYDVTDIAARVSWVLQGAPVTYVRVFAPDDLALANPLSEFEVDVTGQETGEFIVTGLEPMTEYQIAIYSGLTGGTLRGWVNYFTLEKGVYPGDPGVVDLTNSDDPDAFEPAVASAPEGAIILLKKGMTFNIPDGALNKSIVVRGEYGFGPEKATLYSTGDWSIEEGAQIDYVRFIDIRLEGEDNGGDYVFNPNISSAETNFGEVTFENCEITYFRGIMRIRSLVFVENYNIHNCIVWDIGGYGIFTADTDGDNMAAFSNVSLRNSTFYKINTMFQSRQNSQSFLIEDCTWHEFVVTNGRVFRYRGDDGKDNVLDGITIINTIWSHAWDQSGGDDFRCRFIAEGLGSTNFTLGNNYGTNEFTFSDGSELAGFPDLMYSGGAEDLWVDPENGDFTIKDNTFAGRFSTGDPRWRPSL